MNRDGRFIGADLQAGGNEGLQSRDDLGWGQRRAIGELDAGTELELPSTQVGIMGPFGGESGLESAVIVEGEQTVEDEDGQLFVLCGGRGTRSPLAWVQGDFAGAKEDAQRATITRVLGRARGGSEKQEESKSTTHRIRPSSGEARGRRG